MSTNLNCVFVEKEPRSWFYELERYHERDEYDTYGPFGTFGTARRHLSANHANPGGYSIEPLPGCKHDLLANSPHEDWRTKERVDECERCGHTVTLADRATWDALILPAIRKRFPGRQSPLLKASLDAVFAARESVASAPYLVGSAIARATQEAVEAALHAAGLPDCQDYKRVGYHIGSISARDDGSIVINHIIPGSNRDTPAHEAAVEKYIDVLTAAGIPARKARFAGMLVAGPVRRPAAKKTRAKKASRAHASDTQPTLTA